MQVRCLCTRTVSQACIGCHNGRYRSSKDTFTLGDPMGELMVEIPLSLQE